MLKNWLAMVFIIIMMLLLAPRSGMSGLIQTSVSREPEDPKIESYLPIDFDKRPDQRFKVWVFFTDKGATELNEIEFLVENKVRKLLPRTLSRRKKATGEERISGLFDLDVSKEYIDSVLRTGAVHRTTSRWLNAVSIEATAREIHEISLLPFVSSVRPVAGLMRREIPPEISATREEPFLNLREAFQHDYGNSLTQSMLIVVPPLHDLGYSGNGILIGVLDTGFRKDHLAISGLDIVAEHDFVFDDDDTQYDPSDPDDYSDSHGTAVLSIMAGNAEGELIGPAFGASFLLGKTEDTRSETPIEEDYWVEGIEWMETQGVDIVSSSLGYTRFDDDTGYEFSDLDGNTAVTTVAADFAASLGVLVVNAAGNSRGSEWGHIITPADGDSVMAVGAVNSAGVLASFSSPGPTYDGRTKPDVCAMGVGNYYALNVDTVSYSYGSGTSFATPMVAGAAALILEAQQGWTAMEIMEKLKDTASQSDFPDNDYGWGIINALRAADLDLPFVMFLDLTVDDDSTGESLGNGNGFPEAGETVELAITVTNLGDTTASGLTAALRTQDIYVSLTDSAETFPDLEPDDSTACEDDFDFSLSDTLPMAHDVSFTVLISDGESREWEYDFLIHTGQMFLVSGEVMGPDLLPLPNTLILSLGPIDSLGKFLEFDTTLTDEEGHFEKYFFPGNYSVQALQDGYLLSDGMFITLPPDTSLSFTLTSPELSIDTDSLVMWLDEGLAGSDTITVTNTGTGTLFFSVQEANYPQSRAWRTSPEHTEVIAGAVARLLEDRQQWMRRSANITGAYDGKVSPPAINYSPVDSLWNFIYPDTDQKTDMDIKSFYFQFNPGEDMLYFRLTGYRPWAEVPGTWWGVFVLDADANPMTGDPEFGGNEYILLRDPLLGELLLEWNEVMQDYDFIDFLPYAVVEDSVFEVGINRTMIELTGEDPQLMNVVGGFLWPVGLDTASLGDAFPADGGTEVISVTIHDDQWLKFEPQWALLAPSTSAEIIVDVELESPEEETLRSSLLFVFNEPLSEPFKLPVIVHTPTGIEPGEEEKQIPIAYSLSQNFPNPFNPITNMHYDVPNSTAGKVKVLIRIFDMRGRFVRTLVDEEKEPGSYSVVWDGTDERGEVVSSGVYLYRMDSGDFSSLKKMILLR